MASQRWVLLLRGVNVGGVTILSADLTSLLVDAGFAEVRTVLASGNALVTFEGSADEVRQRAEHALETRYGRPVPVIVRTQTELAQELEACPYDLDSPTHHAYLVLAGASLDSAALAEAVEAAATIADESGHDVVDEQVQTGDRVLYWWCPRGSTLATPTSKAIERSARQVVTTTRNGRTVRRLVTG